MADEHYASMMENLYWWGIPTLFRCPNEGPEGQDIALVGVPHSTGNGTTERDQHLGPRALRNVSAVGRRPRGGETGWSPSCNNLHHREKVELLIGALFCILDGYKHYIRRPRRHS